MPAPVGSTVFAALQAADLPVYSGTWSPLALVFIVCMVFLSLGLLVALFILGLMGRLTRHVKPDEEIFVPPPPASTGAVFRMPGENGKNALPQDAPTLGVSEDATLQTENNVEKNTVPSAEPPRQTGLWCLLCGMAAPVLGIISFSVFDSSATGMVRIFTPGMALCLLFFAAQIYLTVRLVHIQRKL